MRIFNRAAAETAPPDDTDQAEDQAPAPTSEATPDELRRQAAQDRTEAEHARAAADAIVTTARAQAARLVADAEQQARDLATKARAAEQRAARLEDRAQYRQHANALEQQAGNAEQTARELAAEASDINAQAEARAQRLADLGGQREEVTVRLAAAREAGDVAAVSAARAELAGVDEVVAVLDGQQRTARERLDIIGAPDGGGELARTLAQAQTARVELRRILNILDPDRPEAQADRLLDGFRGAFEAQVGLLVTADQPQTTQPRVIDLRASRTPRSMT